MSRMVMVLLLAAGAFLILPRLLSPPPQKDQPKTNGTDPVHQDPGNGETSTTPKVATQEYPEKVSPLPPTKRFRISFTNKGAGVEKLELYYPDSGHDPIPMLLPNDPTIPHLGLEILSGAKDPVERVPWKVHEKTNTSIEYR